jgi:uncharacterized protein YcbX
VVTAIRIYPVKSLGGVEVSEAMVEPWGLRHDRRWIVLEPDGDYLTARREHAMLAITATPREDAGITLATRDGSTITVEAPVDGELVPASVSRLGSVRLADAKASAWLSSTLNRDVRLGWLDDPRRRTVSEAHGGAAGDALSLADAGPLLLATQASLDQLSAWAAADAAERGDAPPAPFAMERFRPNVAVALDAPPFAEDAWSSLRIGTTALRQSERCDRCVLTTIDPETLEGGKEPLRTLARHRRFAGKTWFGIRLVPLEVGTLAVGDGVAPVGSSS